MEKRKNKFKWNLVFVCVCVCDLMQLLSLQYCTFITIRPPNMHHVMSDSLTLC